MGQILDDILLFVEELTPILQSLPAGLAFLSELDLALDVGGEAHFTRTARFPPEVLTGLASLGITLAVTGYPTSEE